MVHHAVFIEYYGLLWYTITKSGSIGFIPCITTVYYSIPWFYHGIFVSLGYEDFICPQIVRNDTGYQLWKFHTNPITNLKMADKMTAVKHYNWM